MAVSEAQVRQQMQKVMDPELGKDLVTLNMVKAIAVRDGTVDLTIELTTPACPMKDKIRGDVEQAVRELGPEVRDINIEFTAQVRPSPQQKAAQDNPLPNVKHIVAVGAGKGRSWRKRRRTGDRCRCEPAFVSDSDEPPRRLHPPR